MNKNIINNRYIAYLDAIFCTLLWGTAFPFIKLGYQILYIAESDVGSKLLFAGERFAIAGILVFIFCLLTNKKSALPKKSDIKSILLLGLVQTTLQYLFSYTGVGFTTATNTSVVTGTVALISVIMASFFFKSDKLTFLKVIGCIIGFSGIFFVNFGEFNFESVTFLGDFLVLMSAFCGAGGNIITKKITSNKNPVTLTAFQLFFGGLILVVIGIVMGGKTCYNNLQAILILSWLSLVSAVAFLLWTILLRHHPVSRISVFNMLIPIFGTLWSGILLGEDIFKWQYLVSLVFISAGIILVNAKGEKHNEN